MRDSNGGGMKQTHLEEKSCPVGSLHELPNIIRELGHDPWPLLESFGVKAEMMARPLTPLPVSVHGRLIQAAAELTSCENLGLMLGQRAHLEIAGPLLLLLLHARTENEAIEHLVRFVALWFRPVHLNYSRHQGYAQVSIAMAGTFPGRDQLMTAYLAALVNHLETIFGQPRRPTRVHVAHRQPKNTEPYERFFRATVLFDQPQYEVFFPDVSLDRLRTGSDHKIDTFLCQYMSELESKIAPDLVSQVKHVIMSLLSSGDCNVERVAELFSVHRFTLYRYLREAGTTFESLVDETRRDLAIDMLQHSDQPIAAIAAELGFASPTGFVRAFARWYDMTPKTLRHQMRGARRAPATARPSRKSRR